MASRTTVVGQDAHRSAELIEAELARVGTPERAVQERAYLKSDLRFLGASMPAIHRVIKDFSTTHPDLGHQDLMALAEALWRPPVYERRAAAVELLTGFAAQLAPADAGSLERWLRESRTWALVDGLSASVVAVLVERYPAELGPVLDRWSGDEDFWVRRASLLALLPPLRRGDGDFERFARYAEGMLEEREFFIRKAIGWVLREVGKGRPDLVSSWLGPRVERASGVTVREAVKYLPAADRERLLAAYRAAPATRRG